MGFAFLVNGCFWSLLDYGLLVGVDHGLKLFPGDICFFWLQWFVNVSDFTVYSNQICTAQMDRNDQNRAVFELLYEVSI